MNRILDTYDESIKVAYNYTYKILMKLKNISVYYKNLKNPDEVTLEVYRDSIINKYETLEDLSWKLLSKIFKADGLEINSPRGCYKQAFKDGLIEDVAIWNDILITRKLSAHIYDEENYEKIKNNIMEKYIEAIEKLLNKISIKIYGIIKK